MTPRLVARVELATGEPFDGATMMAFLRAFAVPGVEAYGTDAEGEWLARALRLPGGVGLVRLCWTGSVLVADLRVEPPDRDEALRQVSRLCDPAADSAAIDAHLGADPALAPLVAEAPGVRVPGGVEPVELAFRTMLAQQISLAAAARCGTKVAERYGERLPENDWGVDWLFPTPAALAVVDPAELPMPRARGRALVGVAQRLVTGDLDLSSDRPVTELRRDLLACPGIGPWTADSVRMRGFGDPDVLLDTDLAIRRQLVARGVTDTAAWSPYRSYATAHLWRRYVV